MWVMVYKFSGGDWVVAAMVGGILLVILIPVAFQVGLPPSEDSLLDGRADREAIASTDPVSVPTATRIGLGLLGVPGDDVSGYLLRFEIISIHLLVVLVGAAYLARAKRRVAVSDADAQDAQDGMES